MIAQLVYHGIEENAATEDMSDLPFCSDWHVRYEDKRLRNRSQS
jgi:hypothetical protein